MSARKDKPRYWVLCRARSEPPIYCAGLAESGKIRITMDHKKALRLHTRAEARYRRGSFWWCKDQFARWVPVPVYY